MIVFNIKYTYHLEKHLRTQRSSHLSCLKSSKSVIVFSLAVLQLNEHQVKVGLLAASLWRDGLQLLHSDPAALPAVTDRWNNQFRGKNI
jgi:hypothetical protein